MPLPRWRLKFQGKSHRLCVGSPRCMTCGNSAEWPAGSGHADRWTARRAWSAGAKSEVVLSGGPKPRPRAGAAFPTSPQATASVLAPVERRVRGACRRGCHGFRGHVGALRRSL